MTAFYNVGTRRRAHTGRTCCSNGSGSGSNRGCIHISGAHPHPLLAAVVISEAIILMQAASVPWAADADAVVVGVAFGVGVGVVSPKRRHLVECHMRKHTHRKTHTPSHTAIRSGVGAVDLKLVKLLESQR